MSFHEHLEPYKDMDKAVDHNEKLWKFIDDYKEMVVARDELLRVKATGNFTEENEIELALMETTVKDGANFIIDKIKKDILKEE